MSVPKVPSLRRTHISYFRSSLLSTRVERHDDRKYVICVLGLKGALLRAGELTVLFQQTVYLEKVRLLLGGGGGPGLRRGGSSVNFLQIGEGQTCFILSRGRVTVFLARKKLPHVASILYIQAKLPVKINLNYLQLSKNLHIKKLSSPN